MKPEHKNAWRAKRSLILAGAAVLALSVGAGCEKANWEDPAYISKKLGEKDPAVTRMALEHARKLTDDQKVELIPALSAVYLEGGSGQKEAMSILVQLRNPASSEAYISELQTDATGYASASAEAIGTAKIREAIPQMLATLEKTDSGDLKQGILRGLAKMPDPQLVGPLTNILKLDVDNHPIALHAYACEILGEVGQAKPDALDDDARRTLLRAVFLANSRSQNVGRECGLAVQQVGPSMVPLLLETFEGKNEDVQKLLMSYNKAPDFAFPSNHAKLMATVRLTSMRAQEAVGPFIADLAGMKEAPAVLGKTNHAVSWRVKEGQITDEIILGLGDLGDPSARAVLELTLSGERNKVGWEDITDGMVELQLRQDAANALNKLGDREALPALLKAASEGVIGDLERRFSMLEKRGEPASSLERYQFNWMAAQAYAMLATGEHEAEFQGLISKTKDEKLAEKYKSFLPLFAVAKECGGKADDAARAACYGEKLKDKDNVLSEKAALELSRLPKEVSGPVLIANLDTNNLNTREAISFGLYRAPSKEAAEKISEVLEKESSRNGADYRLDHNRLRLLRGWMVAHMGPSATSER